MEEEETKSLGKKAQKMPKLSAKKMSAKKMAFVFEYQKDLNASAAATRAGYAPSAAGKSGWRLLQEPDVQAALAETAGARSVRTAIDADYVLQGIRSVTETAVEQGEQAVALKGYELLGKHLRLFVDRVEAKTEATVRGYVIVPGKTALDSDA